MSASTVKSLERAIRILECFRDQQRPLSASEVTRLLGIPSSSGFALLRSLAQIGYLSLDPKSHEYFPTLQVTELGSWLPTVSFGLEEPRRLLDEIRDATDETVTLSVQNELSMQVMAVAIGTQPMTAYARPGDRLPLFSSCIGQVALSGRTDAEIGEFFARAKQGRMAGTETIDRDEVLAQVTKVRQRGYGIRHDAVNDGLGAIGWPLRTSNPDRIMVIAVAGPSPRMEAAEATIRRAVGRIFTRYQVRS